MAKRENYNELYLFMQVVREGSFTAAAQRLGLAQSGVSRKRAARTVLTG
ncbi:LysR family transcriptional regulator, partial [Citrobacter portucalensis]